MVKDDIILEFVKPGGIADDNARIKFHQGYYLSRVLCGENLQQFLKWHRHQILYIATCSNSSISGVVILYCLEVFSSEAKGY